MTVNSQTVPNARFKRTNMAYACFLQNNTVYTGNFPLLLDQTWHEYKLAGN